MKIREATYNDLEGIKNLCVRNGLEIKKINEEVWKNHPSINDFANVPIGWVIESENKKIVGVILNLFMTYHLNGKRYKASVVSTWAVDLEYRMRSLNLFQSWHNQTNVDILVDNRRSERSVKLLQSYKFPNVPTKDYKNILYWVFDYSNFFKSVIKKKTKLPISFLTIFPAFLFKFFDLFFRNNKNLKSELNLKETSIFDEKFDVFWKNIPKKNKFISERNSANLKWHFERLIKNKKVFVLTINENEILKGYTILMRSDNLSIGLKRYKIVDLQVLDNDENIILDLIRNAIIYSQNKGAHVLELSGFGAVVRNQALKTKPFTRKLSYSPFFYKLISKDLKLAFTDKVKWDASLFDGDGSLDAID